MNSTILSYIMIRGMILDCDILLYKGSGLVSDGIKWFTGSEFSHAGFAVWWDNRLMVLEAVAPQIVTAPLTESIAKYHGDVYLYRVHGVPSEIRAH